MKNYNNQDHKLRKQDYLEAGHLEAGHNYQ